MPGSQAEHDEGAAQVGADHPVEALQVAVGDLQVGHRAGAVDHHVDAAEGAPGGFEQLVHVLRAGHVALYGDGRAAGGDDFGHDLVGHGLVAGIVDRDRETVGGQPPGNGATDAAGGAGDDGGLGDVRHAGTLLE